MLLGVEKVGEITTDGSIKYIEYNKNPYGKTYIE